MKDTIKGIAISVVVLMLVGLAFAEEDTIIFHENFIHKNLRPAFPHYICPIHGDIGTGCFYICLEPENGTQEERIYCLQCICEFLDRYVSQVTEKED